MRSRGPFDPYLQPPKQVLREVARSSERLQELAEGDPRSCGSTRRGHRIAAK